MLECILSVMVSTLEKSSVVDLTSNWYRSGNWDVGFDNTRGMFNGVWNVSELVELSKLDCMIVVNT